MTDKKYYRLTGTPTTTQTASAAYGRRRFEKGKSYTVRRKLTEAEAQRWRVQSGSMGWKKVTVKKIRR